VSTVQQATDSISGFKRQLVDATSTSAGRARSLTPLTRAPQGESAIGNLVADSLRFATQADFAIINPFSIRSNLPSGDITQGALYSVLPIANQVVKVRVTGRELKAILSAGVHGDASRGVFPVSGLILTAAKQVGGNSLIDVKRMDGKPLDLDPDDPSKGYTLATSDYIFSGGNDMGDVFSLGGEAQKYSRLVSGNYGIMRDATIGYLREIFQSGGTVPNKDLYDPAHPRLILQ
jgi:5'-nucleotidase